MAAQRKKNPTRKKKSSRTKKKKQHIYNYEISGIILLAVALLGLFRLGFIGQLIYSCSEFIVGNLSYILLLAISLLAGYLIVKRKVPRLFTKRLMGSYFIIIGILTIIHMIFVSHIFKFHTPVLTSTWHLAIQNLLQPNKVHSLGGGLVGAVVVAPAYFLISKVGTYILGGLLILGGISLISGVPMRTFIDKVNQVIHFLNEKSKQQFERLKAKRIAQKANVPQKNNDTIKTSPKHEHSENNVLEPEKIPPIISNFSSSVQTGLLKDTALSDKEPEKESESLKEELQFEQESFENEIYQLPPVDLLKKSEPVDQSKEYNQIKANARVLEETFASFGVKAKITQIHLGPAVTKYEVQPAVGVKVSRIVSLADDIALALAAKDIRIEAPIPGKSAIGIEVANKAVAMVSLRDVIEHNPDDKMEIALGRDISGEAVLAHLNKMPHLLVAGSTGSGKSVCINGIITSILLRAKPHEVKLMMIDPKMVELSVYNGIPHLLAPVVTNPKKASQALQKVVVEMERRYDLFSHVGARNIEGYNGHVQEQNNENEEKQPELPYIVVIVDELADLMMVASSDVEEAIIRLAQMGRAAGVHLIIATQRPSVDVITGLIKANIPSRIAFAVSSATDSRTILDMGGAEKLLGRGDMLFLPIGSTKPTRVQGAFLSDGEVEKVVSYVVSQQKAQYNEEMIPDDLPEVTEEVEDELYDEAVSLVVEMQTASVSMLQRKFRIGYNRAARLIDEMEDRGVVGPHEGSKPRRVNIESLQPEEE